jgi:hypothetical protein
MLEEQFGVILAEHPVVEGLQINIPSCKARRK